MTGNLSKKDFRNPESIRIGTGGIPLSTEIIKSNGKKLTGRQSGVYRTHELGLNHIEMEFVHGVRINAKEAEAIRNTALEQNVSLSAHGSYYINLASKEKPKYHASINRVKKVIEAGNLMDAQSVTFHPAYYQGRDSRKVSEMVYKAILKAIEKANWTEMDNPPLISPETTGKGSQWGTISEITELADRINQKLGKFAVSICVDFAHIHARSNGRYNTYEEFMGIFDQIESDLGSEALKRLHMHISGIKYSKKGEIKHLKLKEADLDYKSLIKALKDREIKGWIVCESPILEKDALLLKEAYTDGN